MWLACSIWRFYCGIGDFTLSLIIGNFRVIFFDFNLLLRRKKAVQGMWAWSSCTNAGSDVWSSCTEFSWRDRLNRGPCLSVLMRQSAPSISPLFSSRSVATGVLHSIGFLHDFYWIDWFLLCTCQEIVFFNRPSLASPPITCRHVAGVSEPRIHLHLRLDLSRVSRNRTHTNQYLYSTI